MPIISGPGGGSASAGLVKLFESTVTGSAAASIDTGSNGIAAGHKDLVVYLLAAGTAANNTIGLTFNNDSGANYDWSLVRNDGSNTANATSATAASAAVIGQTGSATVPNAVQLVIPGYDGTVLQKGGSGTCGQAVDTQAWAVSFAWLSTAAITQLKVSAGATTFAVGSRLIVYGTK